MSEQSFQSVNEISSMGEEPTTPDGGGEKGSLCNRFILEAAIVEQNIENMPLAVAAPKIWISKSASMDDNLEGDEEN